MGKSSKSILTAIMALIAALMATKSASAAAVIDSGFKPYFIAGGAVTTLIFLSIGAILIRKGNRILRAATAAAQWPVVTGQVLSSDVAKRLDRSQDGPSHVFIPRVHYAYRVDGASREGRTIRMGLEDRGYSREPRARGHAANYPAGSDVAVRYDPRNPADAVLEFGQIGAGSSRFAGVLFTLIGLGCVAFTIFSIVTPGG